MRTAIALAASLALFACDKKSNPANQQPAQEPVPPPPAPAPTNNKPEPPPPTPPQSKGEAALTLGGAIEATLDATNSTVTCGGSGDRGSFKVRPNDGAYELAIPITAAADWDEPAIIVNATKPARVSYVRRDKRPIDTVELARDFSKASLDVVLRNVVGKETLTVKGAITCK